MTTAIDQAESKSLKLEVDELLRSIKSALHDKDHPHKDGNYSGLNQKVRLDEIGLNEVINIIRDKVEEVAQDHEEEYTLFLRHDFAHDLSTKIKVDIFDHVIGQFKGLCPEENPAKADKMEGENHTQQMHDYAK